DPDHQPAGAVAGAAAQGDQPGDDECPHHGEPEPDVHVAVLVREGGRLDLADADRRQDERRQDGDGDPAGPHRSSAATRAPESSAFAMNPRAPHEPTRAPKSLPSRLDVSTTWTPPSSPVTVEATAKPSVSGSWMSSSTTSGASSRAVRTPSAPLPASPTTSNPSDSSSARARARKPGWSSTIRTRSAMSPSSHTPGFQAIRVATLFRSAALTLRGRRRDGGRRRAAGARPRARAGPGRRRRGPRP